MIHNGFLIKSVEMSAHVPRKKQRVGNEPENQPKAVEKAKNPRQLFVTPPALADAIRTYIPAGVRTIWEPTAGTGALVNKFREWGYKVIASDINPHASLPGTLKLDYITEEPSEPYDMIIFNPPFGPKDVIASFWKRTHELHLKLGVPFAFICMINQLGNDKRVPVMRDLNMSLVLPMDGHRANFTSHSQPSFYSVWVLKSTDASLQGKLLY